VWMRGKQGQEKGTRSHTYMMHRTHTHTQRTKRERGREKVKQSTHTKREREEKGKAKGGKGGGEKGLHIYYSFPTAASGGRRQHEGREKRRKKKRKRKGEKKATCASAGCIARMLVCLLFIMYGLVLVRKPGVGRQKVIGAFSSPPSLFRPKRRAFAAIYSIATWGGETCDAWQGLKTS